MKVYLKLPYPENKPEKEGVYVIFKQNMSELDISNYRTKRQAFGDVDADDYWYQLSDGLVTHYLIEVDRVVLSEEEFKEKLNSAFLAGQRREYEEQFGVVPNPCPDFEDYFKDINI